MKSSQSKPQAAYQSPLNTSAIREAAKNISDGAVTAGYQGNRDEILALLNSALATELVCVLRYKRHYYTASGMMNTSIKREFLEHAQDEQGHADQIAERIVQLNGKPDFNPATLVDRSHAEYDGSEDIKAMIRANLVAERVAVESYRQMIEKIGDADPSTKLMLAGILAKEEEHADEMRDLLE
jgi:bacterioferritin